MEVPINPSSPPKTSVKTVVSRAFSYAKMLVPRSRRAWLITIAVILVAGAGLGFWIYRQNGGAGGAALTPQNKLQQQFLAQLPQLQASIAKTPNDPTLQQQLGVAKYATGDLQGAEAAYQKTVTLDPNNAVAHNNLANTYRDLGNYAQAESEYNLAMKLDPQLTTPYMNLASIYQYILGKPDTALQVYAQGIASNPDYVDFYNATAAIYEQEGLTTKAIAEYKLALKTQPGNPAATAGLKRLGQ